MITYYEEHSASWIALMKLYQQFQAAVFYWVKEAEDVRHKDLLMELTPLFGSERDLHRRLFVTDFLQSTDMWDERTIELVWKELTQIALMEQEEVAARAAKALLKLKSPATRLCIAEEIFILAENELQKKKPDFVLFGLGCTLLRQIGCKESFERFCTQYKNQIYLGTGLEEFDLEEMAQSMNYLEK